MRYVQRRPRAPVVVHCHGGEHAVRAPGWRAQHSPCLARIGRLAQDAPGHGRLQLGAGHALQVGGRQFARPHGLQRFDVCVVGQQRRVLDADLLQQLAPARALRRQVEQGG